MHFIKIIHIQPLQYAHTNPINQDLYFDCGSAVHQESPTRLTCLTCLSMSIAVVIEFTLPGFNYCRLLRAWINSFTWSNLKNIIKGTRTIVMIPSMRPAIAQSLLLSNRGWGTDFNARIAKTIASIARSMPSKLIKHIMPSKREAVAYAYFWPTITPCLKCSSFNIINLPSFEYLG